MRYFFTIKDHDWEGDSEATPFRDEHDARAYALCMIWALKERGVSDEKSRVMIISEERGRRVCVIPFCAVQVSAIGSRLH
jgi:hypothetical protein